MLSQSKAGFLFGTGLLLFCLGGNFAMFPALTTKVFGNREGAKIYGFVFSAFAVASIFGSKLTKVISTSCLRCRSDILLCRDFLLVRRTVVFAGLVTIHVSLGLLLHFSMAGAPDHPPFLYMQWSVHQDEREIPALHFLCNSAAAFRSGNPSYTLKKMLLLDNFPPKVQYCYQSETSGTAQLEHFNANCTSMNTSMQTIHPELEACAGRHCRCHGLTSGENPAVDPVR